MSEKKNIPEIRFVGFDDEWEQRKFEEITYLSGEKNKNNLPLESYSITNESGFVPQTEKFENGGTMREADKSMYYIVSPQSFAYNPARINVGSIGYQNLNRNVIVSSLYEVFKTIDTVDDEFLWYWFKSDDFQKMIEQLQEGGVRLYFYYDKLCMGAISLPSKMEQCRIGEYLKCFDRLIDLHQRKHSQLCNIKKSMLEKMFPKEGATVPEIRFAGFTNDWELQKASELFSSIADKGYPDLPVLSATQDKGMVIRDDIGKNIFHDMTNEAGYKRVVPGQFVIHLRSFQGGFAHAAVEGITSPAYTVFDFQKPEKHDDYFWKFVFSSRNFIKRLESVTYGIRDGRSISYSEFLTMGFAFPSSDEQQRIAIFLLELDHLITLYQRELDRLQNIKKACLEKMFV